MLFSRKIPIQYLIDTISQLSISANYNYHTLSPENTNYTSILVFYHHTNPNTYQFYEHQFKDIILIFFPSQTLRCIEHNTQYDLINKPYILRFLNQLNARIKLYSSKNLWHCREMLLSCIAGELSYGYENPFALRFITSENTFYSETSIRIEYISSNKKWIFNFNLLKGWQTIVYAFHRQSLSVDYQIQYQSNQHWLLTSSSYLFFFFNHLRWFHNFYSTHTLKKFTLLKIFDISHQKYKWFSYDILIKCNLPNKISIATRQKKYSNIYSTIIPAKNQYTTFNNISTSIIVKINKHLLFKTKYKYFYSNNDYFNKASVPLSYSYINYFNTLIFDL